MPDKPLTVCNIQGRAHLVVGDHILDIESHSDGKLSADVMALFEQWDELRRWAAGVHVKPGAAPYDPRQLGPCVPTPRQVFAIGLNYRDHASEAKLQEPAQPMVFTKFPSCVAGATAEIKLTGDTVDWEVELVVVIGKLTRNVSADRALEQVAGYCIGQDISDRRLQFLSVPPQFSLSKSAPNFGPIGPAIVDAQGIDPQKLALYCDINKDRMQNGSTADMIFPVATLIEYLSERTTLLPGDLIFTGTPSGVGSVRNPRRYLQHDDVIRSEISGLGVLENRCVMG